MGIISSFSKGLGSLGQWFVSFFTYNNEKGVYSAAPEDDVDYGDPEFDEDTIEFEQNQPSYAKNVIDKALFIRQEDRGVIVVEQVLLDIPNWVEWDMDRNSVSIVLADGESLEIKPPVPKKDIELYQSLKRILLVTRMEDGRNIMHYVNFHAH